jgi:hypothetical protein
VLPPGWRPAPVYQPVRITDPLTRLAASSHPVRLTPSACQLGIYRVPRDGALVVLLEWRSAASGPTTPRPAPVRLTDLHLRPGGIECQPARVRGGAVQFVDHGRRLGVYLMLGERAGARTLRKALAVMNSLRAGPRR